MSDNGTTVRVSALPDCDVCKGAAVKRPAAYDAKTQYGPWAYLCEYHFTALGPATLGTGRGQRLVVEESLHARLRREAGLDS